MSYAEEFLCSPLRVARLELAGVLLALHLQY